MSQIIETPEGVIGQPIPKMPDFYASGPSDHYNLGSECFPYGQDSGPRFVKMQQSHPDTGQIVIGWKHVEGGAEPPPLPTGTARSM